MKDVFMDISIGGQLEGRLKLKLFQDKTPTTCDNFRSLCEGNCGTTKDGKPRHYKGSPFHRIIPGFMCQGGDYTRGDGRGGESKWGTQFADENFILQHDRPYLLSMANAGPGTNGSQFFLTTAVTDWLNGKHVVFGEVYPECQGIVKAMEACGSASGTPSKNVVITDCGLL